MEPNFVHYYMTFCQHIYNVNYIVFSYAYTMRADVAMQAYTAPRSLAT